MVNSAASTVGWLLAAHRRSPISSGGAVYPPLPLTNPVESAVEYRSATDGFVTAVVFATCFPVLAAQMFAQSSRSASVTFIAVQQVTAVALLYVSAVLAGLIVGRAGVRRPDVIRPSGHESSPFAGDGVAGSDQTERACL